MGVVRFALLGDLRIRIGEGDWSRVPGQLPRALLAELLLNANAAVSIDRLSEVVWRGRPPGSARAALYNHVLRLRRLLADDSGTRLRTADPGYLIRVEPGELDAGVFDELATAALASLHAGDWQRAADDFSAALAWWRGQPLADVPQLDEQDVRLQRLAESRLRALDGRIEADLALGRHHELTAELRSLTAAQPLRESFHAHLMTALYRANRQAEALDAYQQLRSVLVSELGIEPSPAVRELHQRILRADPGLLPAQAPAAPRPARRQLPAGTRLFTGRAEEAARLTKLALAAADEAAAGTAALVCVIEGMGGVGKTALAVHIAQAVREAFPDGQFFLDLRGYSEGLAPLSAGEALGRLLRSLGVPAESVPRDVDERAALYRDRLSGSRALIVLDNAGSAGQVRPLVPGHGGCLLLVTSRKRLPSLDDAVTVALDVLPGADAVELLRKGAGSGRLPAGHPAAEVLAGLCGRLPLALRIVAARLRHQPLMAPEELIAQLQDGAARLDRLRDDDRSLTAVLRTSVEALDPEERRLFAGLGHVPGADFGIGAVCALTGKGRGEVEPLLAALTADNLLIQHTAGRYQFHDLVRSYACGLDEPPPLDHLLDHYLRCAQAADRRLAQQHRPTPAAGASGEPDGLTDALGWLRADGSNVLACIEYAADHGLTARMVELTAAMAAGLHLEGSPGKAAGLHARAAAAAARLGDRLSQANALSDLGRIHLKTGDYPQAQRAHREALALYTGLGSTLGEANARYDLGHVEFMAGNYEAAASLYGQSMDLHERNGDQLGIGKARHGFGRIDFIHGDYQASVRRCASALVAFQHAGSRGNQAIALIALARAHLMLGHSDTAERLFEQALAAHTQVGNLVGQANAMTDLGLLYFETGRIHDSLGVLTEAARRFEDLGARAGVANASHSLGRAHQVTGEFTTAATLHSRALRICRQIGDKLGVANAQHNLGLIRYATGDPGGAAGLHRQALDGYRAIGDRLGQANAIHCLGLIHAADGDTAAAMDHCQRALGIVQDLGMDQAAAEILTSIGTLTAAAGDPRQALAHYQQAVRLAREASSPLTEARARHAAGLCAQRTGDRQAAIAGLHQAVALYRRIGAAEAATASAELAELERG